MAVETRELAPTQEKSLAEEEPKGFAKTIQFTETALAEGAHRNISERNLDATLTYLLSPPDTSLEDVGNIYDYTRERARQIRGKTMKYLWLNSLPETQSRFPLEELELNKPKTQKTKENIIFSKDQVESRSSHQKNQDLLRNLKNAKTDEEKQRILDQVPYSFYLENVKGDTPFLMTVKKAIVNAGYHIRRPQESSLFYGVIKIEEIPMVNIPRKTKVGSKEIVLSYHAVLTEDYEERVKNAWRKREDLQKFLISPVQQVAGPEQQEIPSTYLIEQRSRFRTLGTLLLEFGAGLGRPSKRSRTLLLEKYDLPVPIFHAHKGYYYPVEKDAEVRSYTGQFLETLRTTS